jgi:hypothetical protein
MHIVNILKRQTLNIEKINKTLDRMSLFINNDIEDFNEGENYIVVINKDIQGIMFYDKITNDLYYDKNTLNKRLSNRFRYNYYEIKNSAVEKVFKQRYPNLKVRNVSTKRLTVI